MKKLIRREKLKLVETFKTIAIVLLFLLSLFLGYRILRLYNAQTNMEGALWGSVGGTAEVMESGQDFELGIVYDLPQPYIMLAGSQNSRHQVDGSSQLFDDIADISNLLLGEFYRLETEEISAATEEEWQTALGSESVYLRYPVERFLITDTALLDVKTANRIDRVQGYSEIIISLDQTDNTSVWLLVRDCDTEKVIKAKISGSTAKVFAGKARKLNYSAQKDHIFAWELNLHKKNSGSNAAFDSMILIPAEEVKAPHIRVDVPKLYKSGLNFTKATDLTIGLINTFNYNPNTIRQYVSSDGSIMFVGETGSLSLGTDGFIEYKALDSADGVPLSAKQSLSDTTNALCSMIEKIMRISGINTANADFKVKLTSLPEAYKFSEKSEISFDYYIKDKKLEFPDSKGIWAVVQNGKLVEIKMHLKNAELQGGQSEMAELTEKINGFCAANPEYNEIKNAYGVYKYDGEAEEIAAEWKIEGIR